MINKSKLWFLTLSGIILVLAVYYIAFPEAELKSVFSTNAETEVKELDAESVAITAMKIEQDSTYEKEMKNLQDILLNAKKTKEEKSNAYDEIKYLNSKKSLEEKIMNLVDKEFKVSSFANVDADTVMVVIDSKEGSYSLANDIMNKINKTLKSNYYITVKFE